MTDLIRCVWVREKQFGYGKAMRVAESTHPRYVVGSRFDYGFLEIASMQGYRIEIEPVSPVLRATLEEAEHDRQFATVESK